VISAFAAVESEINLQHGGVHEGRVVMAWPARRWRACAAAQRERTPSAHGVPAASVRSDKVPKAERASPRRPDRQAASISSGKVASAVKAGS
jgi:hypothetical protein